MWLARREHPGSDRQAVYGFELRNGNETAEGQAAVRVVPARVYERMRVMPSTDPRALLMDLPVMDLPDGKVIRSGRVTSDPDDPILVDHVSDHMSAMTTVVCIENELLRAGAARVDVMHATFHTFAELTDQLRFDLHLCPDGSFASVLSQNGHLCMHIRGRVALSVARRTL